MRSEVAELPPRCKDSLEQELEKLLREGKIPVVRGTISRNALQRLLKFPPNSLIKSSKATNWSWARKAVNSFELTLRDTKVIAAIWEARAPAVKAHLERLHKLRQLPLNAKGKLNRKQVLSSLKLPNANTYIIEKRSSTLRALFAEYDLIVASAGYTQYSYKNLDSRVAKLLDSDDLELSSGIAVNLKWLATALGLKSPGPFRHTPSIAALVELKNEELRKGSTRGKTQRVFRIAGVDHLNLGHRPYSEKHGRLFAFGDLIPILGLRCAECFGTCFHHVANSLESPKAAYSRLKHFVHWLPTQGAEFEDIMSALAACKALPGPLFERAAMRYKQDIVAEYRAVAGSTKQRRHPNLAVIEKFGEIGVFPNFKFPRARRRGAARRGGARPTLAEARSIRGDADKILEIYADAALYRNIEFDINNDTKAFAQNLAIERRSRDDLPDSLPEAIKILCDERLSDLHEASASEFSAWHSLFEEGRRLIVEAPFPGREIFEALQRSNASSKTQRYAAVRAKFFPRSDRDLTLRSVLAVIEAGFGSCCPVAMGEEWGQLWRHIYALVGGVAYVQPRLAAPLSVVSAALTMYLCESGANIAVALTCDSAALRPSQVPKHTQVVSTKARAGGKPIILDLPNENANGHLSAVQALQHLTEATKPLRARAGGREDRIALFPRGGSVHAVEEWSLRGAFKQIAKRTASLGVSCVVPSMIRPTVLLTTQLSNLGDLSVAQRLAHHEHGTTTFGYVRKLPYRIILEDRIRLFANSVQLVISSGAANAGLKWGPTPGRQEETDTKVRMTGLGVFCADPKAGVQLDYPRGVTCRATDRCLECKMIIVIAEPNSIADMMIWQEALLSVESKWLDERYARWTEVWVPWQAFFHVVLEEKMTRGELLGVKMAAQKIVNNRRLLPGFAFPEPW